MKTYSFLLVLMLALFAGSIPAQSQGSIVYLTCVVNQTTNSNSSCPDATTSLRGHNFASTPPSLVIVGGYNSAVGGGGGDFVPGAACQNPGNFTGTPESAHPNVITVSSTSGLAPGFVVSDTLHEIPQGAEISSVGNGQITITQFATGFSQTTISAFGDNGGTQIQDSTNGFSRCWYKTNYRGDPHERGAVGDGNADDSAALQNWLGSLGPWQAIVPATYKANSQLYCAPNSNLYAPANNSRESTVAPLVTIAIGSSFPQGTGATATTAVVTAEQQCRISGLAINAKYPGNSPPNYNGYVDAVHIDANATGVTIDSHSLLENGYYNLLCNQPNTLTVGMQLKDSQFNYSWSDNIYINGCADDRLIGDVIAQAGDLDRTDSAGQSQIGVNITADDVTISNGIIEESQGIGLDLNDANHLYVLGMVVDQSGENTAHGGAGIEIDGTNNVTICGNNIHFNDNNLTTGSTTAQVRFGWAQQQAGGSYFGSNNINLCGNTYSTKTPQNQTTAIPQYVYDVAGSAPAPLVTGTSFYENPVAQQTGVFSPNAVSTLLPNLQISAGSPNNFMTGFTLSNETTSSKVDIAPGQAADSTNATLITLLPVQGQPACAVDLTKTGLGGLDTGSAHSNTTYFYFVVAPPGGGNTSQFGGTSCMASASLTPAFTAHNTAGYSLFRLVGALYTTGNSSPTVVPFTQDGDTFTLDVPVNDINVSGMAGNTPLFEPLPSVPNGLRVEAFGRCINGTISGTNYVLPYTAPANPSAPQPGTPAYFPTAPGFSVSTAGIPSTVSSFRLYTDTGRNIKAISANSSGTLQCMTDGWVWHRAQ